MLTIAELADAQRQQLEAMWDRCEIRHPDSWAGEVRTAGTVAWQHAGLNLIPCRVAVDNTQPRTAVVGGQVVTDTRLIVTLPIDVSPTVDQVITIVSAQADPSLAGRRFDVNAIDLSTFITARRVRCTEHSG